MTRGTLILILEGAVFESMEFNGRMYLNSDGCGPEAVEMLAKVKSHYDFIKMVNEFNESYFEYEDTGVFEKDDFFDSEWFVDFGVKYFDRFFSDYLYILNRSGEEIQATGKDGKAFVIPAGKVTGVYYGNHISDLEAQIAKN